MSDENMKRANWVGAPAFAANCEYDGRPRSALGIFGGEPARPVKKEET